MSARILQVSLALCLILSACSSAAAPTVTPTSTSLPTATATPPPTATATLAPPSVTTTEAVDCYSGPDPEFIVVDSLKANQQAEVIGHTRNLRFWVIKADNGADCWLDRHSTAYSESDLLRLSALETIPDPELPPPLPPSEVKVSMQCQKTYYEDVKFRPVLYYQYAISLSWRDNATNERGYYIYKNGNVIKQVDPNMISIDVDSGSSRTITYISGAYAVASWNSAGASEKIEVTAAFSCP